MDWIYEKLHVGWTQGFEIGRVEFRNKTEHQDLVIFDNEIWGRVLALDGIIQTTTEDEPHYHEMLTHVPIRAHGQVKSILIIGGGDGGTLRECLRYPDANVTQVEIDGSVIEMSKAHLPSISDGAFDNPRATIVIDDGAAFVANTALRFDVIIIDSTDPIGPGAVLFTEEFYRNCRRALSSGGILITQLGNPRMAPDELATALTRLDGAGFAHVDYYLTDVPTYIGGNMSLGFACDDPVVLEPSDDQLVQPEIDATLRYYTPKIHRAAFAHPAWMLCKFGR